MELRELLAPLRKWWWLLLIGVVVGVSAAYVAMLRQPPAYQTRTTIMIGRAINNPNPDFNDVYVVEQLANTYADIAKRNPVRKAVMASLGLGWLPAYTVQLVPSTQLLEISVTDSDPQRTQAVANELARQLVLQSPTASNSEVQQRQPFVKAQLDRLEGRIQETEEEIARSQDALGSLLSAREIADMQAQIASLQSKLQDLQANYAMLLSNTQEAAFNTLTIVEPAELPTEPVGSGTLRTLGVVAAVSLILAAGVAYFLSYLDDTLKDPSDVQRALGLTTLGMVPVMDGGPDRQEVVMLAEKHSAATEAYRVLRTNLQFAAVDHPLHTLLVTSPAPSEGKSITAANLAVALAQAGRRVIIVDADLHRPRLHHLFGLSNNDGLTSAVLAEQLTVDGLLKATRVPGLQVLTAGPIPPNPTELVGSTRMRDLLGRLSTQADVVVVDSPPVVILADAAVLATQVDGALLVLEAAQTRRDVAQRAVEQLRGVKAHVVGALLNRVPMRGSGYYYYYYYYSKGYQPSGNGRGPGRGGLGGLRRRGRRRRESQPEGVAVAAAQGLPAEAGSAPTVDGFGVERAPGTR